jgi:hypothetical protein
MWSCGTQRKTTPASDVGFFRAVIAKGRANAMDRFLWVMERRGSAMHREVERYMMGLNGRPALPVHDQPDLEKAHRDERSFQMDVAQSIRRWRRRLRPQWVASCQSRMVRHDRIGLMAADRAFGLDFLARSGLEGITAPARSRHRVVSLQVSALPDT